MNQMNKKESNPITSIIQSNNKNNENNQESNQEESLPTIDIIFPVRNRAWILPYFLENIYKLDYPKNKISIITYINDSKDDTEKMLNEYKLKYEKEYNKINIYKYDLNSPEYANNGIRGGIEVVNKPLANGLTRMEQKNTAHKVYKNLGKLRNHLLHKTTSDFIFSIDTDIMCKPDTLKKLLAHNVDMVSALICNGHMVAKDFNCDPYIFTNIMRKNKDDETKYIHVSVEEYSNSNINNDSNSLIEVDLTGAIALMSKRLCKSGAKYDFNNFGEDANFCLEVQKKGFRIYSDVRIRLPHIMSQEYLDKYLTGEFVF